MHISIHAVKTFDPSHRFSTNAISRLEALYGICVVDELAADHHFFPSAVGVNVKILYAGILKDWESGRGPFSPTWTELFRILKELNLGNLAQQIEKCMAGSHSPDHPAIEGLTLEEEVDEEDYQDEGKRMCTFLKLIMKFLVDAHCSV